MATTRKAKPTRRTRKAPRPASAGHQAREDHRAHAAQGGATLDRIKRATKWDTKAADVMRLVRVWKPGEGRRIARHRGALSPAEA
jgi:hypothetical protein